MKTKMTGLFGAVLAAAMPAMALAQDGGSPLPGSFSANVALTNDYVFRGVSQTDGDPAIQGGFDWDSGAGFYIGTWASSLEFGNDASIELDLYAGYSGSIDNFSYDVGFLYYLYPSTSSPGINMWEVYGSAGYDFGPAAVNFGINYTPDNTGPTNNDASVYYSGSISAPITDLLSISGGIGYSALEGAQNYTDWNVGATLSVYDWFDLDARYYDTDYEAVCGTLCDARFVVTISKSF